MAGVSVLLYVGLLGLVSSQVLVINNPPTDAVGRVDMDVNLTCTTSGTPTEDEGNALEWNEYNYFDEVSARIMADPGYPPDPVKYTMLETKHDLQIKDLEWQDAGRYTCKVFHETSPHEAHLFVFEQHAMTFNQMAEDAYQNLTCEARFGASTFYMQDSNNHPVMEMYVAGRELSVVQHLTLGTESSPYILRGWGDYTAKASDDKEDFDCAVKLNSPNQYVTDSIAADVQYPVTQMPTLSPQDDRFYVGDQINCTGEGNPTPDYTWYSLESPVGEWVRIQSRYLLITEEMIGEGVPDGGAPNNRWRCDVTNSVGGGVNGNESRTIEFSVDFEPGTEPSTSGVEAWKIAVGICVPLAVIAIVVAVVLVVMRKKKKAREAAESKPYGPPPEVTGEVNNAGVFPSDVDVANGKPGVPGKNPVSVMPDPLDNPVNRSKDSPGYADLGIKHIHGSYPGVNVSINSSMDSFDESASHIKPPNLEPRSQPANPGRNQQPPRSQYSNMPPNHPDTFV